MAYYEVTNGQTSHDTVLNNNDSMYIYDGMALKTTVNSGGIVRVFEKGELISTYRPGPGAHRE